MTAHASTLGSIAVQAPSLTPKTVHVSPATCHDLSLFKAMVFLNASCNCSGDIDLLKEYRKLDDTITMRLNRTSAQFRDRDRMGLGGNTNLEDQACAQIWRELIANWKRRTEIVEYCVGVVDQSMSEKRQSLDGQENDPTQQRRIQGALYAEEVKRNQVHNELVVEKIVRQRSLDAFRSRCKYFEPPFSEAEARKWWEAIRAGR